MEKLVAVAKLNVYCPKFVLLRHEELQKVFDPDSTSEYCVKVFQFPTSQYSAWNKEYVLRFEIDVKREAEHWSIYPIQEETREETELYVQ